MKYSFNSFPFASCLSWLPVYTVEETIARLADAGYDAVELGCAAPHAWPEYMTPQKLGAIRRCFEKRDVKCSSVLIPSGGGPGLNSASFDPQERAAAIRLNKQVLDIGYELGAPILLYVGGWYGYGMPRAEAWKLTVEALNEIADYAAERDITVCIEPTADEANLIECAEDALALIQDSGRGNVAARFDVEHVLYRMEDPRDYVLGLGGLLKHLHVTDAGRVPPGDGVYDFAPMMQALKDIGYAGYVTVETGFGRKYRPADVAARSLAYLKSVEAKLQ